MEEINIRDIQSKNDLEKFKDVTTIVFSDPEREMNGFDATRIVKNEEGFELDSAYILKEDAGYFSKAVQLAKHLNWF